MDMVCRDGIAEADRRSVLRAKNRACTPRMNLFVIYVFEDRRFHEERNRRSNSLKVGYFSERGAISQCDDLHSIRPFSRDMPHFFSLCQKQKRFCITFRQCCIKQRSVLGELMSMKSSYGVFLFSLVVYLLCCSQYARKAHSLK